MCKWDQPQISFTNIISSFFLIALTTITSSSGGSLAIFLYQNSFFVLTTHNILVARNPDDIFIDHLEVQMLRISWNPQPNAAEYQ